MSALPPISPNGFVLSEEEAGIFLPVGVLLGT